MKIKNVSLGFSLIILFLLTFSISGNSQGINPNNFGANYNVNIGDSMQYKFSKVILNRQPYPQETFFLPNGTTVFYNESLNTVITMKVIGKNVSLDNYPQIFVDVHLSDDNTGLNKTFVTNYTSGFLDYGFNNINDLTDYTRASIQAFNNESSNLSINQTLISYEIINDSYTSNIKLMTLQNVYYFTIKQNWKNGWLESLDVKDYFYNGTLLSEIQQIQVQNHSLGNQIINNNFLEVIFGSGVIFIAILVVLISYISYRKNLKDDPNNYSFKRYFINKISFKPRKKEKNQINAEKALGLLEEIINETNENK